MSKYRHGVDLPRFWIWRYPRHTWTIAWAVTLLALATCGPAYMMEVVFFLLSAPVWAAVPGAFCAAVPVVYALLWIARQEQGYRPDL